MTYPASDQELRWELLKLYAGDLERAQNAEFWIWNGTPPSSGGEGCGSEIVGREPARTAQIDVIAPSSAKAEAPSDGCSTEEARAQQEQQCRECEGTGILVYDDGERIHGHEECPSCRVEEERPTPPLGAIAEGDSPQRVAGTIPAPHVWQEITANRLAIEAERKAARDAERERRKAVHAAWVAKNAAIDADPLIPPPRLDRRPESRRAGT